MLKQIGTVKDWLEHNPEVRITHPKLQEGVYITGITFHKNGQKCTYNSHSPEGEPMIPFFGNQCPYVVKGKAKYIGYAIHTMYGCGGGTVLSESFANDPNWTEFKDK